MRILESQLWSWISNARRQFPPGEIDLGRIENGVQMGMPDVEGYRKTYGQFWLELKCAAWPKREETKIRFDIRPHQIAWCRRRWNIGGQVFFIVQVGSGPERFIGFYPGDQGEELRAGVHIPRGSVGFGKKKAADLFRALPYRAIEARC